MESTNKGGSTIGGSISKLVMELIGTFFFTIFFTTHSQVVMLAGLWILTIFFWKISGSIFNPAVTLALMFRRDDRKMPIGLGVAMIGAQLAGGLLGALIVNFFTFNLAELEQENWFLAILQELLCSFLFVFFYQITTDETMLFSNEKAINCFIIACSYVGSRSIFYGNGYSATMHYGAVMNPAVAFGLCISGLFSKGFASLSYIWLYPTIPFGGALIAVFFYELIYKKAKAFIDESYNGNVSVGSSEGSNDGGEHD